MSPRSRFVVAVLLLAPAFACNPTQMAILWHHLTGGETIEAKFKLTKGKLAVIVDDPQGFVVTPVTFREFHDKFVEALRANGIESKVIPFEEWQQLRQRDPDYNTDKMTRRLIGEKLGADQVLFLNVTDFRLKKEPAAPIYEGRFAVRVAIYSTERKRDVRLWPLQSDGEDVVVTTKPGPSDADDSAGDISRQLADEMADSVAKLFYDHKEKD